MEAGNLQGLRPAKLGDLTQGPHRGAAERTVIGLVNGPVCQLGMRNEEKQGPTPGLRHWVVGGATEWTRKGRRAASEKKTGFCRE